MGEVLHTAIEVVAIAVGTGILLLIVLCAPSVSELADILRQHRCTTGRHDAPTIPNPRHHRRTAPLLLTPQTPSAWSTSADEQFTRTLLADEDAAARQLLTGRMSKSAYRIRMQELARRNERTSRPPP
ncbi:hypothetical protein [Nocardia farcinica]|uniref:hypothetical protein n=1 Tax=Nocardia farcinica TaxID=37329 RepID=UPI0012FF14BE|nr:hypothetical protein [Nocardia farcinica]